jgi:hypothetical protein
MVIIEGIMVTSCEGFETIIVSSQSLTCFLTRSFRGLAA